jgi:dihydropteroate synthase
MLDFRTLRRLIQEHGAALDAPVREFDIGGRPFRFNERRTLMGVINLSLDSWYQESVCRTEAEAIARGIALAEQGADFVDLGAESTLPNAARVGREEQIARLIPPIRALAARGILCSVESYDPAVLEAAALAGARIFNLTGFAEEDEALRLAARFEAAVILCYVQGQHVRQVGNFEFADDVTAEQEAYFREHLARATALGVQRLIVDPGLGFYYRNLEDGALRVNYQLHTFVNAFRWNRLGYPILNILPHAPEIFGPELRRSAEPFFAVLAMLGGTHIVRTHEMPVVAKIRAALDAYRGQPGAGSREKG